MIDGMFVMEKSCEVDGWQVCGAGPSREGPNLACEILKGYLSTSDIILRISENGRNLGNVIVSYGSMHYSVRWCDR